MNVTISQKGLLLVSIPLFFQLTFILLVAQLQEKNAQAQELATHTQQVISQGHTVRANLLDAQSGLRGYLLTADAKFDKNFRQAASRIHKNTRQLQHLVTDNPEQQALAERLSREADAVVAWFQESARLIPGSDPKKIKERVRNPAGQHLLDAFNASLDQFLQEEERLHEERTRALEDTRQQLNQLLLVGGLCLFALTAVLAGLFTRHITGRIKMLAANNRRLARQEPLAPRFGGADELAALDATFHDMAEALAAAARRDREHQDTLERRVAERTAELTEANRQLRERNADNEMFVYSVSHDLRSPLVNLQGFSQELLMISQDLRALFDDAALPEAARRRGLELLDNGVGESTHFIQTAVKRLSSIIDALLRLSRAGRVVYQPQAVDLTDVVHRVAEVLQGSIAQGGATVVVQPLPPAWGDPTALEQALANLVANAVKYLDPARPGRIEVGCVGADERALGMTTYFVRDNGLGIPANCLGKVFQVFQRVHLHVPGGEGMGLAIVRRIIDRHRGEVWVESVEGVGSTFFIALPPGPGEGGVTRNGPPAAAGADSKGETWQTNR